MVQKYSSGKDGIKVGEGPRRMLQDAAWRLAVNPGEDNGEEVTGRSYLGD